MCGSWAQHQKVQRSAFDYSRMNELVCDSSNPPRPGRSLDTLEHGQVGFNFYYPFPMLIAAIDPIQEAKLVGLDHAVVQGRYLTTEDRTRVVRHRSCTDFGYLRIPVLMASRPLTDDSVSLRVRRLETGSSDDLPARLGLPGAARWAAQLPGSTVTTVRVTDRQSYARLLRQYGSGAVNAKLNYWSAGPSEYQRTSSGALSPVPRPPASPETFRDFYFGGYFAPAPSGDVGFRPLSVPHQSNTAIVDCTLQSPTIQQVGVFDPDRIAGFSDLSKVPLTTYYPPDAAPGDARTKRLLHGRSLLPNANLAGYLQQPPMVLTTMRALHTFKDPDSYPFITPAEVQAPVSVIRVRVAGVTGPDETSRERVRLAAERIARETGLTVDITIGSSPTPQRIALGAGSSGRPELTLTEGWVKKGVSVELLSGVDKKSLALFGLVLVVCLMFMGNATLAAVRTRRTELGVLACLGWRAGQILWILECELLVTGVIAGALGTGLAALVVAVSGLHVTWWHIALITPVATVLAATAGVIPAWRASHAAPMEALRPDVRGPTKAAASVRSINGLALVGVRRLPGRTVLGAASLFIGVCALAVLLALQHAFRGAATGTALGDVIAVQVRGVDYLAAAVTIALGAFAIADTAYLNISERTAEIGTLRSMGWTEGHIRRLFAVEALATASLGAVAGAVFGVAGAAALLPISLGTSLAAAAVSVLGGVVAAMAAATGPLSRLSKIAPAAAVNAE
ncbi:MAG: hypothetical protein JWO76_2153 [Nocardioides sp.]|nr:hypothetical protein [Nocardioides sp.]